MSDANPKNKREAAETAYGLLWTMQIDNRDPNMKLASLARQQLLRFIDKDGQKRGIERARWLGGFAHKPEGE